MQELLASGPFETPVKNRTTAQARTTTPKTKAKAKKIATPKAKAKTKKPKALKASFARPEPNIPVPCMSHEGLDIPKE